jgi:DNA polymerase-3 subunit epsilon
MYLFIDCETTGLAKNFKAPATDIDNWPRLVQLAYLLYDEDENSIESYSAIIKPVGFEISADATKIHGIAHERALKDGILLVDALQRLRAAGYRSDLTITHNIDFDSKILLAEVIRIFGEDAYTEVGELIFGKDRCVCTMKKGISVCKLPGKYKDFKWPKLNELYKVLFQKDFVGAHDSACDVQAMADCYFEKKRRLL